MNAPAPKRVRNCHVTEKLPPQASPPQFWRSQHHTLTWQRRGAPPAPLLPHPPPPKKACPASEGKKNKRYRPRADPPTTPRYPSAVPHLSARSIFLGGSPWLGEGALRPRRGALASASATEYYAWPQGRQEGARPLVPGARTGDRKLEKISSPARRRIRDWRRAVQAEVTIGLLLEN